MLLEEIRKKRVAQVKTRHRKDKNALITRVLAANWRDIVKKCPFALASERSAA